MLNKEMEQDYIYCLNENNCLHRRGCKRWIYNYKYPQIEKLYNESESVEKLDDKECITNEFKMLDRFRNSHLSSNNISTLALFSVRYALARNTSADMATVQALNEFWDDISDNIKEQILETIEHEKNIYGYDDFFWNEFLEGKI